MCGTAGAGAYRANNDWNSLWASQVAALPCIARSSRLFDAQPASRPVSETRTSEGNPLYSLFGIRWPARLSNGTSPDMPHSLSRVDGARVLADLHALRAIGAWKTGVHKPTFSEPHMLSLK